MQRLAQRHRNHGHDGKGAKCACKDGALGALEGEEQGEEERLVAKLAEEDEQQALVKALHAAEMHACLFVLLQRAAAHT